ncbi:hypothetical protein [Cupriavidus sp. IDO]|uniref:hypothetical protein n=1 Tax=Cupriavidus sp. IDO TaxID=1539142 RepID=UPI00057923D7|nr:hypothetical protein [Cupriavidus sp. IDO]KWR87509.1 hypothetical protein RM96_24645 [Cupriavidus sp. IDO]
MEVGLWEIGLWIGLAGGLLASGAAVTYLIATSVPEPVFERAQQHGRYAGLGAAPEDRPRPRRRVRRPLALPVAHRARLVPARI